jgi:hypothetical protein
MNMSNTSSFVVIAQPYPYKCWHLEGDYMPVRQTAIIEPQPDTTVRTKVSRVYIIYVKAKSATKPCHSDQAPEFSVYLEHMIHGSMNIGIQNEPIVRPNLTPKMEIACGLNDAASNRIPSVPLIPAQSLGTTDVSLFAFLAIARERI